MDRAKADIVSCLEEIFAPKGMAERNDVAVRKREALPLQSGVLAGEVPEMVAVAMNGLKLHADLLHGQKTGIFLDQRENYIAAARYDRGRALDCFTSTGGFALHLAARCESVEAVDSSEASLRVARMNCDANGIGNVELREADVFELLAGTPRRAGGSTSSCWTLRHSRNRAKAWKRPFAVIARSTGARSNCLAQAAFW